MTFIIKHIYDLMNKSKIVIFVYNNDGPEGGKFNLV